MAHFQAPTVAVALVIMSSVARAAPIPLIKKPACPFECCTYGAWRAVSVLPVFKTPSRTASPVFQLSPGEPFEALTGHVVIRRPGKAVMLTDSPPLKIGDEVAVLSNLGEGSNEAWFEGKVYEIGILRAPLPSCLPVGAAFAILKRPAETVWWVQIRLPSGQAGWIHPDRVNRVFGSDPCGD